MRLSAESNNNNPKAKPHQLGDFLSHITFTFRNLCVSAVYEEKILCRSFQRLPNNQYLGRAIREISLVI